MPVTHFWDNPEQTIYVIQCDGRWTWDDFTQAVLETFSIIGSVEHSVDFVLWFCSQLPPGNAFANLKVAGHNQPQNLYRSVMVSPLPRFLQTIVGTVDKIEKWDGPDFFMDVEEARTWLTEQQMTDKVNL